MEKVKSVLLFIVRTIIILLLISAMCFGTVIAVNKLKGYEKYVMDSDSMSPVLKQGDLIYIENVDFEELKEQDIVTFYKPNTNLIVTHRVTKVDAENGFVYTAGDKNKEPDGAIPASSVIGRYVYKIRFFKFLFGA